MCRRAKIFCIVFLPDPEDYDGESSVHEDLSEGEGSNEMDEESKLMASMGLPVEFGTSSAKKGKVSFQDSFGDFFLYVFIEFLID